MVSALLSKKDPLKEVSSFIQKQLYEILFSLLSDYLHLL